MFAKFYFAVIKTRQINVSTRSTSFWHAIDIRFITLNHTVGLCKALDETNKSRQKFKKN